MEKNCKEQVKAHYKSRMADISGMLAAYHNPEKITENSDYTEYSIFEYGLSFDYVPSGTFFGQRTGYFRYQISWGGPSEEFRFYCRENFRPYKIEYWYMDWFDGAKVTVSNDSKNWNILTDLWDFFDDIIEEVYREAIEE